MSSLAVTWWGHSSTTVELEGVRVGTDPLLTDRLAHLVRQAPSPSADATTVDVVVISHLHGDHLHLPSLRRIDPDVPLVVPRGARTLLGRLGPRTVHEVAPGERLTVGGTDIEVLTARHDGHRLPRGRLLAPALGFRLSVGDHSVWYPGDTGPGDHLRQVDRVDLALLPIGGWGPSLGEQHIGPEQAAEAALFNGSRWALPVHHGTFWPWGLRRVARANHQRLFVDPASRFDLTLFATTTTALPATHGLRQVLMP